MIKPTPEVMKEVENVMRHSPYLRAFLSEWYEHELKNLPKAVNHPALSQGRCQVLGELDKLIEDALNPTAKP